MSLPYPLLATAATPDTLVLASNSSIHLINPSGPSSRALTLPSTTTSFIRQLAISPDSKYAVTVSNDKGFRTYSLAEPIEHLSTRYLTKKPSAISFTDDGDDIIVSDKVGDCYLYPLVPRDVSGDKVKIMDIQADPTLNPEATYLLGHVSVLTSHILTTDENGHKWIISADRDEHIRVTRYPNTFVIERYMFGTEGFVSSIHIPNGSPELLVSGGGESILRVWNWKQGKQIGSIDIADSVLPYRTARSSLRKDKRKRGKKQSEAHADVEVVDPEEEKDFYHVPKGWMLPSGQGILIRSITSLRIADTTIVLFYSEGSAAIHSFIFSPESSSSITTYSTTYPVLDYSLIPGTNDRILITLDTSFNVVTFNQKAAQKPAAVAEDDISQEQREEMKKSYRIVQIASDGSFSDITSSHPLQSTLDSIITSPTNQTTSKDLSTLNLYPDLSLFPRWPGLEEDDDLAGPSTDPIPSDPTPSTGVVMEPSGPRKEYTHEEYQVMNLKHLGRLKAQGYKVDDYMRTKRRETKDRRFEAKRARLDAGLEVGGDEEEEGEGEELSNA